MPRVGLSRAQRQGARKNTNNLKRKGTAKVNSQSNKSYDDYLNERAGRTYQRQWKKKYK